MIKQDFSKKRHREKGWIHGATRVIPSFPHSTYREEIHWKPKLPNSILNFNLVVPFVCI
uniref:Uncharacterized protein n=1 Tax=Rhizophora mucronata TaxID=61149 RepID=A0A2P2PG13_RHIMU